jgi:hypothetical protein
MADLTPEDIVDLGRWYAIQFRDQETAEAALDRYERYRVRVEREATSHGKRRDRREEPPSPRAA